MKLFDLFIYFPVVSVYTNNYKLLNELRANAFSREHDNLSAACYRCLADILLSQKQLSIKVYILNTH